MKRRKFLTLIGGATAWPLAARPQQTRLPIVGFLGANATTWNAWTTAFVQRLHELGWIEGRTVAIEYRWNEGQPERIAEIAAEFIHLKVDVIVTNAISAPLPLRRSNLRLTRFMLLAMRSFPLIAAASLPSH